MEDKYFEALKRAGFNGFLSIQNNEKEAEVRLESAISQEILNKYKRLKAARQITPGR